MSQSLRLIAACLLCTIVGGAAADQDRQSVSPSPSDPTRVSPGGFTLDLVHTSTSEGTVPDEPSRFSLGLVGREPDDDSEDETSVFSVPALSFDAALESDDRPTHDFEFAFDEISGVLVKRGRADPLQLHLAAELERVIPGYRSQGLLFSLDVDAIVTSIRDWWRRRREHRRPAAASLPLDGAVTLVVRDTGGEPPAFISVVPLTDGWVGDAVHASCSATGRCDVNGLPEAPSALLVRGEGAAVVPWRPSDRNLAVHLRPTGTVRLMPPSLARCRPQKVRIVEETTGLVVPVVRWLNPQRGSWVSLDRVGLPLVLPVGVYKVEVERGQGPAPLETVAVEADGEVEVDVEACGAPHP